MQLFTKEILKKIPTCDETAELSIEQSTVYVKLFLPSCGFYWYITAYTPDTKEAFGFVNLNDPEMAELGYISMEELETTKDRLGLGVERDMSFTQMPLKQVMETIQSGGHV